MGRNAFPVVFDGHNDVLVRLGGPDGGGPSAFGSGSIVGDKREVVAVQKEPQTNLVHLLRLGKR